MKRNLLSLLSAFATTALPIQFAVAQGTGAPAATTEKIAEFDQKFTTEALQGGMAEVEMGKLASEKGTRDDVKKFGQRMVEDHGKAGAELESIAKEKGIPIPKGLSTKVSEKIEKLSKLSDESFDKAYIHEMVADHKHDVAEFEKAAPRLKDSDLKAYAEKTLPVLKSHLENIKEIKNAKK